MPLHVRSSFWYLIRHINGRSEGHLVMLAPMQFAAVLLLTLVAAQWHSTRTLILFDRKVNTE